MNISMYIHPGFSMSPFLLVPFHLLQTLLCPLLHLSSFFLCIRIKFMTTFSVKPVLSTWAYLYIYIYNFYNYWQLTISSFFDHKHLLLALNYCLTGISQGSPRNRTGRMCVYIRIHVHVHTHTWKFLYIIWNWLMQSWRLMSPDIPRVSWRVGDPG